MNFEIFLHRFSFKKINILLIILIFIQDFSIAQTISRAVIIEGIKYLALANKESEGKLSTGETIKPWCNHGVCGFLIQYKGRNIPIGYGDNLNDIKIYEFSFGGGVEKELVALIKIKPISQRGNYDPETVIISVFHYSQGVIRKIFEKNIVLSNKIELRQKYIEYYLPSGLNEIWHYYNGSFYKMIPVSIRN